MLLDELSAKQRKKEFKSRSKELRSKDAAIRHAAMEIVFAEPRYLIEGECLIPLLETLIPQKVQYLFG